MAVQGKVVANYSTYPGQSLSMGSLLLKVSQILSVLKVFANGPQNGPRGVVQLKRGANASITRFKVIFKVLENGCVCTLIQLYYLMNIVEGTIYKHSSHRKSSLQPIDLKIDWVSGLYLTINQVHTRLSNKYGQMIPSIVTHSYICLNKV